MKRTVLSLAAAVAAMAISTTVSIAVEAVVLRDSPVYRSRTSNQVVNEVGRNQIVEVVECRSNRCRIEDIPGRDGWVRQNRLAPLDDESEPGLSLQLNIGPGGPGFSVGIGGSANVEDPSRGPRVCLYQHENYGGAQRCFARGTTINNLTRLGWNDVASSLRVYGGAGAQVCEHENGGGACYNFNTNASTFGGFNDLATYIDVY